MVARIAPDVAGADIMPPAAALAAEDEVEVVLQVNGKLRDKVMVAVGADDETLRAVAMNNDKVQSFVGGREPRKVIVVGGRLVNIVV